MDRKSNIMGRLSQSWKLVRESGLRGLKGRERCRNNLFLASLGTSKESVIESPAPSREQQVQKYLA